MAKQYKKGETVTCPHCFEEQECVVEDCVILGKTGKASETEEQCWSCDDFYIVSALGNDEFEVRASDEPHEYDQEDDEDDF